MDDRPNYYVLLGLDPSVDDPEVIERAIQENARRWSSQKSQGSLKDRRRARDSHDALPKIRRLMNDPAARRAEAVNAPLFVERERRTRLAKLEADIAVLRAGGSCTADDIEQLVKSRGDGVSEQDVLERVRAAGVIVGEAENAPDGPSTDRPQLHPSRMDQLRPFLEQLGCKNLYEFLALRRISSSRALCDRADAINTDILSKGRTDAEASARKELAGACMAIFKSDEERAKYDNAIAFEPMESLSPRIELAARRGFITPDAQDELVRQAIELGVTEDDARAYLAKRARDRKWQLQRAAAPRAVAARQCGYCSATETNAAASHCRNCGKPLVIACPRCKASNPTTNPSCTKCGFTIGDEPVVKALLAEAREHSTRGDFAAALVDLDRALTYWPGWEDATRARGDVVARRDAREASLREVEQLVRTRMFVAARRVLDRVQRTFGEAGSERPDGEIAAALASAQRLEREGDALVARGRADEAIERYERALESCADLPGAAAAIAANPPDAPAALQATGLASGFRLRWQPAPGRGRVRYRVVRKAEGAPQRADDGLVVGEVDDAQLDDAGVPVGVRVYYAVFALRGGVLSRRAAFVGPLLLTADVEKAQAIAGDREVTIRWTRPPGCERVEVWRAAGTAPPRRGAGERLDAGADAAYDTSVRNGERYGYLVVAVYRDPSTPGGETFTPGVTLSATPAQPPPPVADLRARRNGSTVNLAWTPPAGASTQIRRATAAPDAAPGTVVPVGALEQFGTLLDVRTAGSAEYRIDVQGQHVFVPVTVAGSIAVVGRPVTIVTIDDVGDAVARTNGRDIFLTWAWPANAGEVVVCYRNDRYPSAPDERGATSAVVTRTAYDRAGGFEIRTRRAERYFFMLFVRAPAGEFYSAGTPAFASLGQETTVRYHTGSTKGTMFSRALRAAWVELQCDEPIASLPPLVVRGKQGRQPLTPTDGALLAEVAELRFADGRARIDIPADGIAGATYVKLFFKDGQHAKEIRLQPAASERVRLG